MCETPVIGGRAGVAASAMPLLIASAPINRMTAFICIALLSVRNIIAGGQLLIADECQVIAVAPAVHGKAAAIAPEIHQRADLSVAGGHDPDGRRTHPRPSAGGLAQERDGL